MISARTQRWSALSPTRFSTCALTSAVWGQAAPPQMTISLCGPRRRLAIVFGLIVSAISGFAAPANRPNILFLFADDQRYDTLSCAGHPIIQTPTIDRLAAQ